jgi:hypothetical protein
MRKITEKLKSKFKGTKKGIVYLFLIEANNIAIREQYEGFNSDFGVKTPEAFINSKIDEIYKDGSGPFFKEDYKGFDEILNSAQIAKESIINGEYNMSIINFINSAIKSYVPKQIRVTEVPIEASTLLEIAKEQNRPERLKVERVKKERKEKENFTLGLGTLLNDEEEFEEPEAEELEDDSVDGVGGLL